MQKVLSSRKTKKEVSKTNARNHVWVLSRVYMAGTEVRRFDAFVVTSRASGAIRTAYTHDDVRVSVVSHQAPPTSLSDWEGCLTLKPSSNSVPA